MGLKDVKYIFSGGIRGWKGDTPTVHLDIEKISGLGWSPKYSVRDTIVETVKYLSQNEDLLYSRK
jgi:UDP-glucose 4-epimerase